MSAECGSHITAAGQLTTVAGLLKVKKLSNPVCWTLRGSRNNTGTCFNRICPSTGRSIAATTSTTAQADVLCRQLGRHRDVDLPREPKHEQSQGHWLCSAGAVAQSGRGPWVRSLPLPSVPCCHAWKVTTLGGYLSCVLRSGSLDLTCLCASRATNLNPRPGTDF